MQTSERLGAEGAPAWRRGFSAFRETRPAAALDRLRTPEPDTELYEKGISRLGRAMLLPAVAGAVGSLLVLIGASQPTSPFTLDRATASTLADPAFLQGVRLWFFGTGPVRGNVLDGVVAVYAGMFLVIRSWIELARVTRRYEGVPVRAFVPVLVAWSLPMLFVAPLFSHDAFSYVGQGELVSRNINPYIWSTSVLGTGGNSFASLVDKLWSNSTSPYGPVFLGLAGFVVAVVHHDELAAIVGFRVLAVVGVILFAVYVPRLARSYGKDASRAFVLAALNPLVLFHLIGGEHNDALMVGLLVAGLALAREGRPVSGVILCALAGLVKAPALAGVIYIGWDWAGMSASLRERAMAVGKALAVAAVVLVGCTYIVGLGWGWVPALKNPGTVNSWMDPATGLGGLLARIVSGVGLGQHSVTIVNAARGVGLLLAGVVAAWLLLRSDGAERSIFGLGWTLLAVVALGPVVQPWYFVWGVVLLAVIAQRRTRKVIIVLSAVMSFLGLPGGRMLAARLGTAPIAEIGAAVFALVAVAAISFAPRVTHVVRERRAA